MHVSAGHVEVMVSEPFLAGTRFFLQAAGRWCQCRNATCQQRTPQSSPSQGSEFVGNLASGDGQGAGMGGAISLVQRCSEAGCAPASATVAGANISANTAQLAGGAVFYNGTAKGAGLVIR